MSLLSTFPSRKRLYWQLVHTWAGIRLRRKVVLFSVVAGAMLGGLIYKVAPQTYAATVVIRSDPRFGPVTDCGPILVFSKRPLPVRVAAWLDTMAAGVGASNLALADKVSSLFDGQ